MSHSLDPLTFFRKQVDAFVDGHGIVTNGPRESEDDYRKRWQHDKIVRSTQGVNCTGSYSGKIYVKGGIVTGETQQIDYSAPARTCPTTNRAPAPPAACRSKMHWSACSAWPLLRWHVRAGHAIDAILFNTRGLPSLASRGSHGL
jgi:nitrate reductase alpha subunit